MVVLADTLNRKVTIKTPTEAQDAYGAISVTWSDYLTASAHVSTRIGKEVIASETIQPFLFHTVTLRYSSKAAAITPKMRVVYKTRTLEINSVIDPDQKHVQIDLICTEIVSR